MAPAALSFFVACVGCGTSIRGMYESDVRFEHCMALDAATETKATVQRACWDEWVSFYTFGQTRDRIEYARARTKVLGSGSNFDEGDASTRIASRAAPDPTSAMAPPPSMQLDPGDAGAAAAVASADKQRDRCAMACDPVLETCRARCKGPACEAVCGRREARCRTNCMRTNGATPTRNPP